MRATTDYQAIYDEFVKSNQGRLLRETQAKGFLHVFLLYLELPAKQFQEIAEKISQIWSERAEWLRLVQKLEEDFYESIVLNSYCSIDSPEKTLLVLNRSLDSLLVSPEGL
jgi:hypothetical protein